jgi:hypothetical protein
LEDQDAGGGTIFKWILGDKVRWYGQDRSGLGQGSVEGCCQYGNEPSCSMKCLKVRE